MAIIGDDMIVTGGTLIAAARALLDAGASDVIGFATHGVFVGDALDRLVGAELSELIATDTVPLERDSTPKQMVLSVAPLLAETIESIFADASVSAIFAGQEAFLSSQPARPRVRSAPCSAHARGR